MPNPLLGLLTDYPFDRLRDLLDGIQPPAGLRPYLLSVGEPRHAPPAFVAETLATQADGWGRYPPLDGTADFRSAVAQWLRRRYALPDGLIDPDRHVLPLAGTREGLFQVAQVIVRPSTTGAADRPLVLMPNPFYQVYVGAAIFAHAEPVFLSATEASGNQPDLTAIDPATLRRTALVYLCSPANPQGSVLDRTALIAAVELARRYEFVLVLDECYADIYGEITPAGGLEACAALGQGCRNVLVFHSLSKRSSAPGLRSGFVAGDPELITAFRRLRAFGGASVPLPVLAASAALWRDDEHARVNRALYREKFALAERLLNDRFGRVSPIGGFFLWLAVDDGERAARRLWGEGAVRVLPGSYLARPSPDGTNPGASRIRLALVDDLESTEDALRRLLSIL
ncbi:MAG: aminotransferase class I/II-fold pyridoxal phosphate-dependent enzyme [Rhodospirillales bacterium]|nr:aminotransferase class I/II-fold pyridoxal phosphate-dependent enzyme [Rhodospirillales bacterium]